MVNFMDLSISFIFGLYRLKLKMEQENDISAIENLKARYPELFSSEFDTFIESAKTTALYLDQKYDQNFSALFLVSDKEKENNLH